MSTVKHFNSSKLILNNDNGTKTCNYNDKKLSSLMGKEKALQQMVGSPQRLDLNVMESQKGLYEGTGKLKQNSKMPNWFKTTTKKVNS